jgi:hypothetical protein
MSEKSNMLLIARHWLMKNRINIGIELNISNVHQYPYPDALPPPGPDTAAAVPF